MSGEIMKKCLWLKASTDTDGKIGLPESCKRKGCPGRFENDVPRGFDACFIQIETIMHLRQTQAKMQVAR
jgi:hypothetical protein